MTRDSVKKSIKKKFGTYSRFCDIVGIDRYQFQKDFLTKRSIDKKELTRIYSLVKSTNMIELDTDLTDKAITKMRKAIEEQGGVSDFCKKNNDFPENTVFQILGGRRKTKSPKVLELMERLGLED